MTLSKQKIARMAGKTTFRDFREGFGGLATTDADVDIKLALGVSRSSVGELPVMVLELRYAQMLEHERAIRHAWDRVLASRCGSKTDQREGHLVVMQRMAAALAIRRFAGARMIQHEIDQYAWMVRCRRRYLEDLMLECETWLDDQCKTASDAFMEAMTGIRRRHKARQLWRLRKERRERKARRVA
jgi:hypothetical protein